MLINSRNFSFNIISISLGQFLGLLINLFTVTLTARYLGVENYGSYNSLLSIVFIASKFTDIGLSNIVFRESAKHPGNFSELNLAISIRIIVFFAVGLILNLVLIFFLKFDYAKLVLTNIFFLATIFSSRFMTFRDLLDIPFKVNLQMLYSNLFSTLDNVLFLIFILLMPFVEISVSYVIYAFIISSIPGFLFSLYFLKKKYNFSYKPSIKYTSWLAKESLPLAGFLVFISIFNQVDILLLSMLDNEYSAGIYAVASRLVIPLTILPTAIATTFFPKVVSNFNEKNNNNFIYNLINKILFIFSISFSIIMTFKADSIISSIFGTQYLQSAIPMIFLIWSSIFLFFSYVSLDFFTADGKQSINLIFGALVVVLSVSLLVILIPDYSYNAAGPTKLLVSIVGAIFVVINLKKLSIKADFVNYNSTAWLIINLIICYLLSFLPLIIYLILSPILLIITALMLKYFTEPELRIILQKLSKEKWAEKIIR